MRAARNFFLGLALLLGGWRAGAQASPGWTEMANMDTGSGVNIEIVSPFATAPASGFIPLQIRVTNHSGGARTYDFQTSSSGAPYLNGSVMSAFQTVRVENDSEGRVEMLLPVLPTVTGYNNYRTITINVSGYGVLTPQLHLPYSYVPNKNPPTVFVSMSETLSSHSWADLEKTLSDEGNMLQGSQTDLTLLPTDWRGLTGVQCLWLTPNDDARLDADRRMAIHDWVSQGGVLYICESAADQPTRAEFGLRDPSGATVPVGFGEVRWFQLEKENALPVERAAAEILGLRNWQRDRQEAAETWPVAKEIGALKLNAPFLLGFIGLFAVLIGPANLFYFAKANRRHRLFWTTPAISLGASLLLIGVIVLQDGFGGTGSRVLLTYLLPAQNKAVTWQEQMSRTGVLFSRGFATADDVYLAPMPYLNTKNRAYRQMGKAYGDDWFASRSVQAQRLETIQQTRARVQLLNTRPARTGAAPAVVSSLPVELAELFYLDDEGVYWHGKNVRTGQAQTLQSESGSSRPDPPETKGSYYLEALLRRTGQRRGNFYAVAEGGPFLETLPSIRWTHDRAIFVGPVTTDR